ncbi:MAG: preprotein translocase subunit SecA [Erysipelotrichaceae bacterium]
MTNLIKLVIDPDHRILAKASKVAKAVESYRIKERLRSDEELRDQTQRYRQRLSSGETLDKLLPEAFATVCEAAVRVLGESPFPEQIMGAYVLHQGDIAEMKTGEGKTLTSILPIYLHSLEGKGVHVVTVNEYLAQRDSQWMGQIFTFLGCTVGLNQNGLFPQEKRYAYACDITYTSNSELGFDYLRDNMVVAPSQRVLRPLAYALIDEVDSILVDEARTPLIISGSEQAENPIYRLADHFAKHLSPNDYVVDVQHGACFLSESGIRKAETSFNMPNLYGEEGVAIVHAVKQALKANYLMKKDVEYVVGEGDIHLVDEFTGRVMQGRQYSDGLHQAIQAKEHIQIKGETLTLATITYQNYFRLYAHLCGMTGTAKTEEPEFLTVYNMRVVPIPTHKPVIRQELPDRVFRKAHEKYDAVVERIQELHSEGRPVLVGTLSVEVSEIISRLLDKKGLKHEVLNAKNHAYEAGIIARAGYKGAITVATNMAGRGTDIKLAPGIAELGGLVVLGTARHESARIDNQLRGRSGRQGDPGLAQFFVSLDDELIRKYASEYMQEKLRPYLEGKEITSQLNAWIDKIQNYAVGQHFDSRKKTLEYDEVMRKQRESIYAWRNQLVDSEEILPTIETMTKRIPEKLFEGDPKTWGIGDKDPWVAQLREIGIGLDEGARRKLVEDKNRKTILNNLFKQLLAPLSTEDPLVLRSARITLIRIIDREWMDHVREMEALKQGIYLRSYANIKPEQAYAEDGMIRFKHMMDQIALDWTAYLIRSTQPKE